MRVYLTLVRRELGMAFNSLTGYVVVAAVLFILGFTLVDLVETLRSGPSDAPVTELFFRTYYFWYAVLLTAPVMTMRSFAAERTSGTYEALMTAPVGDWQVVLSKFTGALLFFLISWMPLALMLFVLRHVANEPLLFVPGIIASTMLGVALVGSLFMAIGCFASALTRSQIVAAMVTFLIGMALWVASYRPLTGLLGSGPQAKFFEHISMIRHVTDYSRGQVEVTHLVFYASAVCFFLFLTHRVIESRRWK
jgi:ABC-2 type transport system permease protein